MTTEERLASNPFAKHGLDADYLRQLESRYGHVLRRADNWPDGDTLDHSSSWVALVPRPTRGGPFETEELGRRQGEWDAAADRFKAMLAESVKSNQRRAAEAAELERQQQERAAEDDQLRLGALTERLRRGYFTIPGATESDFRRDLPALLAEERRRAALGNATPAQSPISLEEMMNPGDLDAA